MHIFLIDLLESCFTKPLQHGVISLFAKIRYRLLLYIFNISLNISHCSIELGLDGRQSLLLVIPVHVETIERLVDIQAIGFFSDLVGQAQKVHSINFLWCFIDELRKLLKLSDLDLRFENTDDIF